MFHALCVFGVAILAEASTILASLRELETDSVLLLQVEDLRIRRVSPSHFAKDENASKTGSSIALKVRSSNGTTGDSGPQGHLEGSAIVSVAALQQGRVHSREPHPGDGQNPGQTAASPAAAISAAISDEKDAAPDVGQEVARMAAVKFKQTKTKDVPADVAHAAVPAVDPSAKTESAVTDEVYKFEDGQHSWQRMEPPPGSRPHHGLPQPHLRSIPASSANAPVGGPLPSLQQVAAVPHAVLGAGHGDRIFGLSRDGAADEKLDSMNVVLRDEGPINNEVRPATGNSNEEMSVEPGAGTIRWSPNPGRCFQTDYQQETNIRLDGCREGDTAQLFLFPPVGTPGPIRSAVDPRMCFDVRYGFGAPGSEIVIWPCSPGQENQLFVVPKASYEAPIKWQSGDTSLCFGALDANSSQGSLSNIILQSCGGDEDENQTFRFSFAAGSMDEATQSERRIEAAAQQEQACQLANTSCGTDGTYCTEGYTGPAYAGGYTSANGFEIVFAEGIERSESGAYAEPEVTLFRWGSVSGTVVGTVAAILASRGEIDLDADIHTYWDIQQEFGVMWPMEYLTCPNGSPAAAVYDFQDNNTDCLKPADIPPERRKVSLRMLLSHTAGVQHYLNGAGSAEPPTELTDNPEINTGMAWAMPYLLDKPLVAVPEEHTSYSSFGLNMAAVTIHRAMNIPYQNLVEELISKPLGLCSLTPGYGWVHQPRAAVGYDDKGNELDMHDVSWKLGAEGYISTAADLMRYGRGLASNTDWLSQDVRYSKEFGLFAMAEDLMNPDPQLENVSKQYSMGFGQVFHSHDAVRVGHQGRTEGSWTTLAVYLGDGRASMTVATNSTCDVCSAGTFKGYTSTDLLVGLETATQPLIEEGADERSSCLPVGQCMDQALTTTSAPSLSSTTSRSLPPPSIKDPDYVVPMYVKESV